MACGKGKLPLANWTSVAKDKDIAHRIMDMTYLTPHFQEETQVQRETLQ